MMKRIIIAVAVLALLAAALVGTGIALTKGAQDEFGQDGYVLTSEGEGITKVNFLSGEKYSSRKSGRVSFSSDGKSRTVDAASFAIGSNGGISALSDGVLLDFNDMSENYINNYYISSGLVISGDGEKYTAESNAGTITFGENLWKLSDGNYLIRSSALKVHFSDADERTVESFVQVNRGEDGIVHIMTSENKWSTISEDCYIETAKGVRVYVLSGIVDNGTYKMTVNEMSVDPDDSIVLSEDETRRQIVPELNFTSIDGENGTDGTIGQDGNEGQDGASGKEGANGIKGDEGESGGGSIDGQPGDPGDPDEKPTTVGEQGDKGSRGTDGADVTTVGAPGINGESGQTPSSAYSALPSMTLSYYEVSATDLYGEITIENSDPLSITKTGGDYTGRVTIYNQETGEKIACCEMTDSRENNGRYTSGDYSFVNFGSGSTVYFTTDGDVLEPDTAYRLSVVAYYQLDSQIYAREFINRTFYTDSTGVYLRDKGATTSTISVEATVSSAYAAAVQDATVYLIPETENEGITRTSSLNGYARAEVTFANGAVSSVSYYDKEGSPAGTGSSMPLQFTGLNSNASYVARVVVHTSKADGTEQTLLTRQELPMKTLKTPPVFDANAKPDVGYNRVSGAFEVFRPVVTDRQNGMESYTYEAINENGDVVHTISITPQASEPVQFFLNSDHYYTFRVVGNFNDNDKQVQYDLGVSDSIRSFGDTMPKLTLSTNFGEYDTFDGVLTIHLGANTVADLSTEHPLVLTLYADGVTTPQDVLTLTHVGESFGVKRSTTPNKTDGSGHELTTVEAYVESGTENSAQTNTLVVQLDLIHLYRNTNYSITVSGYLDMNTDVSAVTGTNWRSGVSLEKYTIGSVSFKTLDPIALQATWSLVEGANDSLKRNLRLTGADENQDRVDYAMQRLQDGEVKLDLYVGTGKTMSPVASKVINDKADLTALFGTDGLNISSTTTFGDVNVNADNDYTLVVASVVDETGTKKIGNGLSNTFTSIGLKSHVVLHELQAPPLTEKPEKGVIATMITNREATQWNMPYDPTLMDDDIVGIAVQATFDNSKRIGKTVTYYAYEYSEFWRSLVNDTAPWDPTGKHPNATGTTGKLMEVTETIGNSDEVPAVAFFFGGEKDGVGHSSDRGKAYWVGEANYGFTLEGMGRGYRYDFAYTVEYCLNEQDQSEENWQTYPNEHPAYVNYAQKYGSGSEGLQALGKNRTQPQFSVYVLHSGMMSVSRNEPEIHSFVYSNEFGTQSQTGGNGTARVYYKIFDNDHTIKTRTDIGSTPTKITWTNTTDHQTMEQNVDDDAHAVTGTALRDWYWFDIDYYLTYQQTETIDATIGVEFYESGVHYEDILRKIIGSSVEDEPYYLCRVPVESSYTSYFNKTEHAGKVGLIVDPDWELNKIYFQLKNNAVSNTQLTNELAGRAYAIEVTASEVGNPSNKTTETMMFKEDDYGVLTATMSTGGLSRFIGAGKRFTFDAKVMYDNGDFGWDLLDGTERYSIQYINTGSEGDNEFSFQTKYYTSTGTLGGVSGAMAKQLSTGGNQTYAPDYVKKSVEDLMTAVNYPASTQGTNAQKKVWLCFSPTVGNGLKQTRAYMDRLGVDFSQEINLAYRDGHYAIPKGTGTYVLNGVYGYDEDGMLEEHENWEVESITPLIYTHTINGALTSIEVTGLRAMNHDLEGGLVNEGTDENPLYYVNLWLVDRGAGDALAYSAADNLDDTTGLVVRKLRVHVGASGNPIRRTDGSGQPMEDEEGNACYKVQDVTDPGHIVELNQVRFENVAQNNKYYISIWAEQDAAGGVVSKVLLDSDTSEKAIYPVSTIDGAEVTFDTQALSYSNTSYFDKIATGYFTTTKTSGLNAEYDLFREEDVTTSTVGGETTYTLAEGAVPILTDAELNVDGGLLSAVKRLAMTRNNIIFDLTPRMLRDKIEPGKSYWLRVRIVDRISGEEAGVGYTTLRINPAGISSALIVVNGASSNSIEFKVTVNDLQNNLMGRKIDEMPTDEGALYAVRFTKTLPGGQEILIQTYYDDELFPADEAQRTFILSGETIIGASVNQTIDPETYYTMHIYAVPDFKHNGMSPSVVAGDTPENYTWEHFFNNYYTGGDPDLMTAPTEEFPSGKQIYKGGDPQNPFTSFVDTFWNNTANVPELDSVEAYFEIASRRQSTTTESGLFINEDGVMMGRNNNTVQLVLTECYGICDSDGHNQAFEKVEWAIRDSWDFQGNAVTGSGTITGDENLFRKSRDSSGYDIFTLNVPSVIPKCSKLIIVFQLYADADDAAPAYTFTCTMRDY